MSGWLAVGRTRCGDYGPWSSSMADAWVDRPGTGNRLGGERAVRPPGAAQAGSEHCRLAVHFILFRSSLHTLAVVLRARATSTPPPL